jgi:lipoprotein-anchoring transpeptidase ErfK/SrfK
MDVMPIRLKAILALLLLLASMASAAEPSATGEMLATQIALEREGFSPGLLDGRSGAKTALAITEFQKSRKLKSAASGKLDPQTRAALELPNESAVTRFTLSDGDLLQVTGPLPKDWNAKAKMPRLGYETALDLVLERFHCSESLLTTLNPGVALASLKPGDVLTVPAPQTPKNIAVRRIEINLDQKVIRCFNAEGEQTGLFHCSIAKNPEKRPHGTARVTGITMDPAYSFDPAMWPEVKNVDRKLLISPGPRNPVGLCWIALSLRGYGIHGTPAPANIGKTGSHGCFRMSNWDAVRLGRAISAGTPVAFVAR